MTPILVDDPILALGMTVNFPPWERFFDFPFRSYSCFRKKILLTAQKVFPLPTVGFYCTVKALALSARGLDKRTLHVNVIIVTVFWHKAESIWSQPLLLSLKVNLVCTQVILVSSVENICITINMWCKITCRRRGGWSDSQSEKGSLEFMINGANETLVHV